MSVQMEQKVLDDIREFFNQTFTSEKIKAIEDVQHASKWHNTKKERDNFLSKAAGTMVTRLMEKSSVPFVNLVFDELTTKTTDKEPNVKFNLSFKMHSLKPYLEFVKVVNGKATKTLVKTVFEISSSAVLKNAKIILNENSKSINQGQLGIQFEISIIQVGVLGFRFESPRVLGQKDFKLDLSKFNFQL
jgi:hypothetical protein